jgi:hypothetical protein
VRYLPKAGQIADENEIILETGGEKILFSLGNSQVIYLEAEPSSREN